MRLHGAALYLLVVCEVGVAACHAPDRWSMTGGSTVDGGLESSDGSRDFDSQWVELGVSGALGRSQEPTRRCETPTLQIPTSAPTAPPIESGDLPWEEIMLLLSGAGAWKASEYGYSKVKSRKRKPE